MSKSLLEKVTLSNRRANPKALALLDVLIGMAIFALIAVIAVIALGQFRQRAFMTGATEDARNIGLALEGASTADGLYPTAKGTGTAAPTAGQINEVADGSVQVFEGAAAKKLTTLTKGNDLIAYTYLAPTASTPAGFKLCVEHKSGTTPDAYAAYNSLNGGIVAKGESGGCPAATTY